MIRHLENGSIYRVKSNAPYGLAFGQDITVPLGWASFSGKATYLEPDWPEPKGNHVFTIYVEDRNNPGEGVDMFWIEVKEGNDVKMTLGRTGGYADPVEIQGGNIVVPHGEVVHRR